MRLKQNILIISILFIFSSVLNAKSNNTINEITKNIAYISAPSLYEVDYERLDISLREIVEDKIKTNPNIKAIQVIDILSKKIVFQAYKQGDEIVYKKDLDYNTGQYSKLIIDSVFDNEIVGNVIIFYDTQSDLDLSIKELQYLKNNKTIKMCNKLSRNPIEYKSKAGKIEGIAIDTIKLVQSKIGHNIQFEQIEVDSWDTTKRYLKENRCDIVSATSYSKEREEIGNFTEPYLDFKFVIITKSNEPFMQSIEDIKSKGIARKDGSGLIKKLKNKFTDINIIETKTFDESFLKVSSGEIYSTIAVAPVATYYIAKHGLSNLKISGYLDIGSSLSVLVRKDNKILHSIIDKALKNIDESEHRKILKKYTTVQIEKKIDYNLIWKILIPFIIIVFGFIYRQKVLNDLNEKLEQRVKEEVKLNKEKEKYIIEQEKLASMGEMIGNIAHQWRQPLSVISSGATGMKLQKEYELLSDEVFNQTCDAINDNAQYLSKTIDDFKDFIKGDRKKSKFNLTKNIDSFLNLVHGTIKSNHIEIILNLDDDIYVDAYENELMQCLINIFNNAKDALNENNIENKLIFISTTVETNNIIIKIKDNAGGIKESILDKIFEPYFTTKHKSQGTGLGLHMTYRLIVESMEGLIEAKNISYNYNNEEFIGAEFIISFPSIDK